MASNAPLRGAGLGERWVVRYRLPDGSATDVIGWLEAVDPSSVRLRVVGGAARVIERAAIVAARRAPAAAGGPHPRRISAEALELHALPGWLAEHEPLGEWTLRSAGGFTGRANSCLAVGDPGLPTADAADRIIAYAEQHGIGPMAQVITGSEPDLGLRAAGWIDTYVPTDVLAVRLGELLGDRPLDEQVEVQEALRPDWWDAYQRSRPNSADPRLLRMILDGNPPRAFGVVHDHRYPQRDVIAIARGHLSGDWLGLASIWTREDDRRQGWATKIIIGLGHWGARLGARYCYLQVASANQQAITAYERLGFTRHHSYYYLRPG
jgi:RimJ/RimL family protein N-acetyltransferase